MAFRLIPLLSLLVVVVFVAGQEDMPSNYPFDCRKNNVGCNGDEEACLLSNGTCNCPAGTAGHDCKLDPTTVAVCLPKQCLYNGVCVVTDSVPGCYCNSNTYGTRCSNPRMSAWCSDTEAFVNIYPHGDDAFNGVAFVLKADNTGRNVETCKLTSVTVTPPDLTTRVNVQDVEGQQPLLEGYYIALPYEPEDPLTTCTPAIKVATSDTDPITGEDVEIRTDYIFRLIVEYRLGLATSLDEMITVNCSFGGTPDGFITTINSASVSIFSDDYKKLNVTETVQPVVFEIWYPGSGIVTNFVMLGDPIDLIFTMQTASATGASYTSLNVIRCGATNADGTSSLDILVDECPTVDASAVFRDSIKQNADFTNTTLPLSAFRFHGSDERVSFTCTVKLCKEADGVDACKKRECPTDPIPAVEGEGGGAAGTGGDAATGGTDNAGGGQPDVPGPPDVPGGVGRRKRAAPEDEREVQTGMRVLNGLEEPGQGQTHGGQGGEDSGQDCLQQSEVTVIIVIFAVALAVMLVVIVVLVLRTLRSRSKVVDAHDVNSDVQSRYTLPRLSLSTTM